MAAPFILDSVILRDAELEGTPNFLWLVPYFLWLIPSIIGVPCDQSGWHYSVNWIDRA